MTPAIIYAAAGLVSLLIVRDIVLKALERYAARPVMERLETHEAAFKSFAIETKQALVAQEKRMDELRAPQNHKAAAIIAGGLGRVGR